MGRIIFLVMIFWGLLAGVSAAQQSVLSAPTVIVAQRYSDLNTAVAAAVTAAGGGRATVWIATATSTAGSVTVAANINFAFTGTGSIVLNSGHTITYNGTTEGWPAQQLFTGAGTLLFGTGASGHAVPQWWGGSANGTNNFTVPLRTALAAVSGSSSIKTVWLPAGIYLTNYETVTGSWVGIPADVRLQGEGYGTEIRGNPASLAEGELGTLLAIEGNNAVIDNLRVNGNKAAISGLTTYGSFGIRIATAATNVRMSHLWVHDLPAAAATEAVGILTNTSGAVSGLTLTQGELWGNNGTGVIINGDYEQARNTTDVFVSDLYIHDNTWHGLRVVGARNVRVETVRSDNNTLDCLRVEFALRVVVTGEGSRCRNGMMIVGDSQDIAASAKLWGNNKTGTSRGQIGIGVGTWGAGQNTKALPYAIDLRNSWTQAPPGDYDVWIDHDATVTSFSDAGTYTIASNVITRSAGTWPAALLPGQIVELSGFATAANNIPVRILTKTSTQLTIDPLLSVLTDEAGTGDEVVLSTFTSMPQYVFANRTLTYRVEDFTDTATTTAIGPYLIQQALNESLVSAAPPKDWLPSATAAVAAFGGTGNQSADAITVTGTANTATLSSPSLLEPGGIYLLRVRYQATATGKAHDWRARVFDGSVLPTDILLTGDSTISATQWREASARIQVGATPAHVRLALLTNTTSTVVVDWITVARLPERASRPALMTSPQVFQGWLTDVAQTLDLGVIPAHCMVQRVDVLITEGFDASGTDTVTVGYTSDTDAYLAAVDVTNPMRWDAPVGVIETVSRDLKAYYIADGDEPTQGSALVTVHCTPVTVEP